MTINFKASNLYNLSELTNELIKQITNEKENHIKEQFKDLCKKGILVIETKQPEVLGLVKDSMDSIKLEYVQHFNLVSKEHEYIKKIEDENILLKNKIKEIEEIVNKWTNR